ncbi:nucleotidyltransferase family protein [Nocardioides daejeonensis]|uniref:nucleotidyltransferase family protein n=1 Tax=Nocardioides daejeonensis TaxID=1046556 RepID=UPI000D746327|nr:nucleotidyltransferase family protein [Nocardioides daejeonensis]
MTVLGLLLAAGAGSRMGQPKALVRDADGASWLLRSVDVLLDGGCDQVRVVLGASYDDAAALLATLDDHRVTHVRASEWAEGMSASLRAGLDAPPTTVSCAVVHLVDLPDVGPEVVRALLAGGAAPSRLARATYGGRSGHPVLIGRQHWPGVRAALGGDQGAKGYLQEHPHERIECGALASGNDVDSRPPTSGQRPGG